MRPTYNNARLHHPLSLSPPLFGYTGMICSSSINYSEFVHGFLSNDIIYGLGMRLEDGGRGVDDKSEISCGFGTLLFKI